MIAINTIKQAVEQYYNIDLTTVSRERQFVHARAIFFKICRNQNHSFHSIGNAINKDHATVMHGCRMYDDVYSQDLSISTAYQEINEKLGEVRTIKNNNFAGLFVKKLMELSKKPEKDEQIEHIVSKMSPEQRDEFINYRLLPFAKMHQLI